MNRRAVLVAAVGAAAAVAGGGVALHRAGAESTDWIWRLALEQPDGGRLALADFRGRPLLINLWAPWCAPCVTEMPLLDRFHAAQRGRGWSVVGLAVDQVAPVREFLRRQPVRFPIALAGARGLDLGRELGNRAGGLPFSIALRADGRVLDRKLGQLDDELLRRWVARAA